MVTALREEGRGAVVGLVAVAVRPTAEGKAAPEHRWPSKEGHPVGGAGGGGNKER